MVLIYAHKSSFRLKYICNLFFKDIYGTEYKITNDKVEFQSHLEAKINYSDEHFGDEIFIPCNPILFETGIKNQNISIDVYKGNKILFKNNNSKATLPFDIFAASFYLVSRYEEYLPHIRDKYDRFEADCSLAFNHQFLTDPLINYWANDFKEILHHRYPKLAFKETKYKYTSTIDIDNAYAFKQKGTMRTIGGYGRSIANFFWVDFRERTKVLLGKMQDPYDTYKLQLDIQKKYNLNVIYFFLLGDYGVNDKNLPSNNKKFRELIKHLRDYAKVGIHPSFGSNGRTEQVKREINRLSQIVHSDIIKSRQHFLKLHFPQTYKHLIENGITDDYTMGYANHIGFRASICTPFYWYDLDTESETNLRIHPFAIMDATLRFYMKVKPEDVPETVTQVINNVKKVNGHLITIWHNETISDWREWKGWQNVYEDVVKIAVQ